MIKSLPKRKRLVLRTIVFASLFIVIISAIFWFLLKPEKQYTPGEKIEGLTAELERSLPEDYPKVTFTDATKSAGINFYHFSDTRSTQLPEDMGSGAAWGDYNNDGWQDLFIANQAGALPNNPDNPNESTAFCQLYHNNGNGTFTEVSAQTGVNVLNWAIAAAWGDYNNDGWLDLFISNYGENLFFKNNGDSDSLGQVTFSDFTKETRLGGIDGFWAGASWTDFNKDGWLDLYVAGYVKYEYQEDQKVSLQYSAEVPVSINPSSFEPERNLLYRNNGNGSFTEISRRAGVAGEQGRSLSATWCDFDEDGWVDLYVANDVSDNVLFRNLGNETFEEISHSAWVADYRGAMGLAAGDWDGDLDMDLFVTHWIAQENALYSNHLSELAKYGNSEQKQFRFVDEADRYGLGQIALDYIGWGTSFFDYDNDGRLDLFISNGSTLQQKEDPTLLIGMKDLLFWNRGDEDGFYEMSPVSGEYFKQEYVGRGAAFSDYDNDGDVDIFIVNNNGPGILLKNDDGNTKNWSKVKLTGTKSNRFAIGAKLKLVTKDRTQIRQVGSQSSYCSQSSVIQHFGLGASTIIDTLKITWPAGTEQEFYELPINQQIEVQEGNNQY